MRGGRGFGVLVAAALWGCGPASGSGGGDLTCPRPTGGTYAVSVSAPRVETCLLTRSQSRLVLRAVYTPAGPTDARGDFVELTIAGFNGPGMYMTSGAANGTELSLRGQYQENAMPQSGAYGTGSIGTCPARTCTISVTGTAPTPGTNTRLRFAIACSQLNTQAADCMTCQVNSSPMVFESTACEAAD